MKIVTVVVIQSKLSMLIDGLMSAAKLESLIVECGTGAALKSSDLGSDRTVMIGLHHG